MRSEVKRAARDAARREARFALGATLAIAIWLLVALAA